MPRLEPSHSLQLGLEEFALWSAGQEANAELSAAAGIGAVGVRLEGRGSERILQILNFERVMALPCVLIGLVGSSVEGMDPRILALFDTLLVAPSAVAARWGVGAAGSPADAFVTLAGKIAANPVAASSLALLLRHGRPEQIEAGLWAESAAYSALQAGAEFERWRASRPLRPIADREAVRIATSRDGSTFKVELARPARGNAVDAAMRDALDRALAEAMDRGDCRVLLSGQGKSFCTGGDLDEFGSRPDPALAHLVRLSRSPARRLDALAARLEARVQGACVGAGIELAAFAGRIVASPDAFFALPEVGMGLVPGAGGTVSLTRRIGRQRTAYLALSGETIGVDTALSWGLIDEVGES